MLDEGEKNPIIIIKSCDISPKHSCDFFVTNGKVH